jgi:predicted transcriptional regulator of viral defense system
MTALNISTDTILRGDFMKQSAVLQCACTYSDLQRYYNSMAITKGPDHQPPATHRVLKMMKGANVTRARDLIGDGIHRVHLQRLEKRGLIQRAGRGLYRLPDAELTEYESYFEAVKRVPNGVICLLSALRFHDLTTQNPFEIWIAIGRGAHRPRVDYPPLRIHHFSGPALTEGVEQHLLEGVTVRVYNPAKTVADCFKFRNKIGVDVAIEALRDTLRQRKATVDEIWHYAGICRVARVIYPYLEALD